MLLNFKTGGTYSYHCALKGSMTRLCMLIINGKLVLVRFVCNVCPEPGSLR
jgi:hypothetical protein